MKPVFFFFFNYCPGGWYVGLSGGIFGVISEAIRLKEILCLRKNIKILQSAMKVEPKINSSNKTEERKKFCCQWLRLKKNRMCCQQLKSSGNEQNYKRQLRPKEKTANTKQQWRPTEKRKDTLVKTKREKTWKEYQCANYSNRYVNQPMKILALISY